MSSIKWVEAEEGGNGGPQWVEVSISRALDTPLTNDELQNYIEAIVVSACA